MSIEQIEAIGRAPASALDTLARAVWQDLGVGTITSAEASAIVEAIEARRRALKRPVQGHSPLKVACPRGGRTAACGQRGAATGGALGTAAADTPHSAPGHLRPRPLTGTSPARGTIPAEHHLDYLGRVAKLARAGPQGGRVQKPEPHG